MTDEYLYKTLLNYAKQGNCFTQEVGHVLLDYKNSGGTQQKVVEFLNIMKQENSNNIVLLNGADDILDIVTGYCSKAMRVWE